MGGGATSRVRRGVQTVASTEYGNYVVGAGVSQRDGMSFFSAHQQLLTEFNEELDAELKEAIHEAGKTAKSYARANAPRSKGKGGGKYRRSFKLDISDKDGHHTAVVSSSRFWMLTHLLDKDHEIRNQYGGPYGTVKGDGHLRDANEVGRKKLETLLGVRL